MLKVDPFYRCYFEDDDHHYIDIDSNMNTMNNIINDYNDNTNSNDDVFKKYMKIATGYHNNYYYLLLSLSPSLYIIIIIN